MLHPVLAAERHAVLAFLATSVRKLAEWLPAVELGTDGEALHQFRVELRRIRSALQSVEGAIPVDVAALVAECRWLARCGSALRDADTFLHRLPEYVDSSVAADADSAHTLRRELAARRNRERRALLRAVRSKRTQLLLARLRALLELSPLAPGWSAQPAVAQALHSNLRKTLKLARALDPQTPVEVVHELRKRSKRLRYLLEMYAAAGCAHETAVLGTRLRKLQNALGEFHDCVAHAALIEALRTPPDGAIHDAAHAAWLERLHEHLEAGAASARSRAIERIAQLEASKARKRLRRELERAMTVARPEVGTNGYCHGFADGNRARMPVGKIVCVGRNYAAHAAELGNPVPERPLLFIKPPSAAVDLAPLLRVPQNAGSVHHEIEIALLIGQELRDATPEQARAAISGIGLALDLTLRDMQDRLKAKGQPWEIAKGFDGAAALGPFVPLDPALDLGALSIRLAVNGRRRQAGSSAEMLMPIIALLCFASSQFSLWPGDVLLTGTPKGVGELKPGDRLSAALEGVCSVRASVVA